MTPKSILPWKYKGATTADGRIWIRNLCTAYIRYFRGVKLQQLFIMSLCCITESSGCAAIQSTVNRLYPPVE
jgi:hypothetical protein